MARSPVIELFAALALALAGCGSSAAGGAGGASSSTSTSSGAPGEACAPGPQAGDLPCDVAAVLARSCQPCHQSPTQHGAHFPLLTYEDTQAQFGVAPEDGGPPKRRWQRMSEVIVPGAQPHMPSQVAPACNGAPCQLVDADRAVLDAWFAACAPPKPEKGGCDKGE